MKIIKGRGIAPGIAIAKLMRYDTDNFLKEYCPGSADEEWEKFIFARRAVVMFFDELYNRAINDHNNETAIIFEAYSLICMDLDFEEIVRCNIYSKQASAITAVETAANRLADLLSSTDISYIQDRIVDIYEISRKITDALSGKDLFNEISFHDEPFILWADNLSPAELFQIDKNYLRGIILSEGSATGHTAILSKSLGVPLIIFVGNKLDIKYVGKTIIMDGETSEIVLSPDNDTLSHYKKKLNAIDNELDKLLSFKGKPTVTKSGKSIKLYCNIDSPDSLPTAVFYDSEGIGLYRSEFLFLQNDYYPSEELQFNEYKKALEIMENKEVIIRISDLGADKTADYLNLPKESNPAMGMRAIRLLFQRKDLLKTQLRALYRASIYGTLSIMFPMITSVWEVQECKAICNDVKAELTSKNIPFSDNIKFGIMIETPAAALISEELAKEVDFFSCGTNDLTQYTLACDRENENIGKYCDPHHPAILKLLEMTATNAQKANIPISICGELASDLSLTEYFISIGITALSVPPNQILRLRRKISEI